MSRIKDYYVGMALQGLLASPDMDPANVAAIPVAAVNVAAATLKQACVVFGHAFEGKPTCARCDYPEPKTGEGPRKKHANRQRT